MKTLTITSARELKGLVNSNRKAITKINNVEFGELYPMLEVSNKHATYYDIESQGNKFLHTPFNVVLK